MSDFENTLTTKPRVPCSANPSDWDLDASGPAQWQRSIQTCRHCPVSAQCHDLARGFAKAGIGPRGMIWAGVAYDSNGKIVADINRHRETPVLRGPTRITRRRTNTLPSHHLSRAPEIPAVTGMHLIMGRRSDPASQQHPAAQPVEAATEP
ncbi:hypothetical protein [Nocardia sp. CDC160]|uniref:hypothetical protein n=1 Tax=Nocardia sp. CDC160 TaxID=3112166 RepID=UPI002DBF4303|nr:hypothetical protein [Nocardia sp. CDC160]MEC3920333.1 hypothetical protein [Nocardia sp. CDC160]